MTIDEMKSIKREHGLTYQDIADKTGVPLGTVQKIFAGVSKAPRYATLEKLSGFFEMLNDKESYLSSLGMEHHDYAASEDGSSTVHETEPMYNAVRKEQDDLVERLLDSKRSGEFTIDDYYIISEKYRIELIDGEIYDMAAPEFDHQHIAGLVYYQMMSFREENGEKCIPGIAPIDVQLDRDDKTMVQPDLIVFCDKKMNHKKVIFGAPDFVMEVFSPSSRYKDRIKKRDKYRAAGCREYWMVDPLNQRVTVLDFEGGLDGIYTFDQKIPVRISGSRCVIDFSRIKSDLIEIGQL